MTTAAERDAPLADGQPHAGEPDLVNVRCPRCGADDARPRYRLRLGSIVSCNRCAMSYVNPRASTAQLERKLQQWAEQDVVDAERLRIAFEPATLAYYSRLLARLERHRRSAGRDFLDIGCSTGALLAVARDGGWNVKGVEIGRDSARHAREVLGLDVHLGSLYTVAMPDASFDAISLVEVIEHLEQPAAALDAVHRLLRPGGLVLVTTPNFDSLYRRLFGSRWWVINCEDEHIVLFTLATLAGMLEERGFEVVDRHIRGVDLIGMVRELRARFGEPGAQSDDAQQTAADAYYESRSAKTRVKQRLEALGILRAARALQRALDATYTWRLSPTYGFGEQIVVVARRKPDGEAPRAITEAKR